MIIPKFEERTIPVYYMESYINEEPSEEAKQFKRILESVKHFELIPSVEEMTAILEYEEKALDYCFKLAINTLHNTGFEEDLTEIYNATNEEGVYKSVLKNQIEFAKYCTLQKILNELLTIRDIKNAVRDVIFNCGINERKILEAVKDLKTE